MYLHPVLATRVFAPWLTDIEIQKGQVYLLACVSYDGVVTQDANAIVVRIAGGWKRALWPLEGLITG